MAPATLDDLVGGARRTTLPFRPAPPPDFFIAKAHAELFDGKLILVTNVHDLAAGDVIARYKALADIERGFRVLNSELDIAPCTTVCRSASVPMPQSASSPWCCIESCDSAFRRAILAYRRHAAWKPFGVFSIIGSPFLSKPFPASRP